MRSVSSTSRIYKIKFSSSSRVDLFSRWINLISLWGSALYAWVEYARRISLRMRRRKGTTIVGYNTTVGSDKTERFFILFPRWKKYFKRKRNADKIAKRSRQKKREPSVNTQVKTLSVRFIRELLDWERERERSSTAVDVGKLCTRKAVSLFSCHFILSSISLTVFPQYALSKTSGRKVWERGRQKTINAFIYRRDQKLLIFYIPSYFLSLLLLLFSVFCAHLPYVTRRLLSVAYIIHPRAAFLRSLPPPVYVLNVSIAACVPFNSLGLCSHYQSDERNEETRRETDATK